MQSLNGFLSPHSFLTVFCRLVLAGQDVMQKSLSLLEEVKYCLSQPGHPDNQERLARVARAVTYSLNGCLSCLPGQQDMDVAITSIRTMSETIRIDQVGRGHPLFFGVQPSPPPPPPGPMGWSEVPYSIFISSDFWFV